MISNIFFKLDITHQQHIDSRLYKETSESCLPPPWLAFPDTRTMPGRCGRQSLSSASHWRARQTSSPQTSVPCCPPVNNNTFILKIEREKERWRKNELTLISKIFSSSLIYIHTHTHTTNLSIVKEDREGHGGAVKLSWLGSTWRMHYNHGLVGQGVALLK